MAGELASFDSLPPEVVDRIVAWCFMKYRAQGRDAAIEALRQKHGIGRPAAEPMVDAAIGRAQGWTLGEALTLADEAERWEQPVPLSAAPALPPFPVGIYPPWIAAEVTALAEFAQVPADLPGVVVLSVLSAALGGRARIEVRPGWREPVNLYTAVALPSGSRKSPVHAALTVPVLTAEAQLAREAAAQIAEARTARAIADKAAAKAAMKAASAEPDKRDELQAEAIALAGLAEAIDGPVIPRLLADD